MSTASIARGGTLRAPAALAGAASESVGRSGAADASGVADPGTAVCFDSDSRARASPGRASGDKAASVVPEPAQDRVSSAATSNGVAPEMLTLASAIAEPELAADSDEGSAAMP